ncbi:hypothetical protein GUITHDRAFT_103683 [Guillardia theta CCMP2712]|uniref:RWP-RK domain-containing protein n=1 Tax=Guillardia theta (strain CCMP2712) TaxID=905079 RepID=L1JQ93_GUITC|nr:hypothetical protein GUITHDRAFT_103683 [Guillardia theta CCMP2712]EKX50449.1 hypothetical protein GUITHDRAFT_103683 [Guillardia theta CCMP2712]|eukprot:XP_005837429.1 hypothetical protein GUITHDRAFT_103683 [Guillardia theta CCMP2712]
MQITEYETAIQPSMYIAPDFSMELQQYNTCYSFYEQTPAQPSCCSSNYCCDPWESSFPTGIQISAFDPTQEAFANPVDQPANDPDAWMLMGPSMQQTPELPCTTVDIVPAYQHCTASSASFQAYPAFPDYSLDDQPPQPHFLQPSNPEVLDHDHDHDHDTDSLSSSDAADMSAAGSPEGEDSFDLDSIFEGSDLEERSVQVHARKGKSMSRSPVVITFELLAEHFHESLETAASKIGIGKSTMKHVCRRLGIEKWPYTHKGHRKNRPRKLAHHQISASSIVFTDSHEFFDAAALPRVAAPEAPGLLGASQPSAPALYMSAGLGEAGAMEEGIGGMYNRGCQGESSGSMISETDLNFLWDCVGRTGMDACRV